MANNNSVTITLLANGGQASAVINGLSNQINRDLSGSLSRATIGANLMTSAISLGLQSVGKLASKAIGLFNSAAGTQSSVISTAGNVMKIAGYNFKEATSFVEDFQTQMAKVAAVVNFEVEGNINDLGESEINVYWTYDDSDPAQLRFIL
ncbi:hypothetical protein [Nostoc sp. ChiQUE01b]|uniref:hypothetical protein n=1 Tax=Nostoc sp. ChiQUE01b TaxID=3075376 RepID=UPI002AD45954|nr:hypothetical protein [Nostoc sp. ChiQUE01b]MDZ8259449.1 hypothetical protein [Nostoc sp. ChiQUE01b]